MITICQPRISRTFYANSVFPYWPHTMNLRDFWRSKFILLLFLKILNEVLPSVFSTNICMATVLFSLGSRLSESRRVTRLETRSHHFTIALARYNRLFYFILPFVAFLAYETTFLFLASLPTAELKNKIKCKVNPHLMASLNLILLLCFSLLSTHSFCFTCWNSLNFGGILAFLVVGGGND